MNAEMEFILRTDRDAKSLGLPTYTELRDIAFTALVEVAADGANANVQHPYRALWCRARAAFFPVVHNASIKA